jgi:hypothetical protein
MNVGTETLYYVRGQYGYKHYRTEQGAKAMATRLNKQYGDTKQWVTMSAAEFDEKHNPMVETTNIMSGKTVMIRKSEKGGCCDPGTERYWSC